jgi:hypothetical protein
MRKKIILALLNRHFSWVLKRIEDYELNRVDHSGIYSICATIDNFLYRVYLSFTLPIYDYCTRGK